MSECCCDDIIIEVNEEGIDGVGIASIELLSTVGITKNYRINLTNGTHFDYSISDGSSIASISKTSSAGLVDTYTVTLTSGDTSTFEVTNGNGIASIVKTSTDNLTDIYTISFTNGTSTTFNVTNGNSIASVSKVSTQVLTDTYEITYTDEDKSPDSFTVVNGRGITSIAKTSTSGLVDTYTVTYNDNSTSTFIVTNGEKGDKGDTGDTGNGIQSLALLSESGLVKTYRITMTDGTHFDFDVTDGEKGDTGETGATGNGIASITLLSESGATKTYRILFTDGTHFDYDVVDGSDEWGAIVGNLSDQTDLQTALDSKAPVITETASGSIASFTDGSPAPVTGLTVGIDPVQAGTGDPSPTNVRPISGWTGCNIFVEDEYDAQATPKVTINFPVSETAPDGIYYGATVDVLAGTMVVDRIFVTLDETADWSMESGSIENFYISNLFTKEYVKNVANTPNYCNMATFVRKETGDIAVGNFTLRSYARTLRIGTSGFGNLDTWLAFVAEHPVELCLILSNPQTIPLTPAQFSTLLGENHIWADTGDVAVEYRADTKLFITEQIAESQRATRSLIAGIETEMVASKNYAEGDLLIVGDTLYKTTANIASGGSITVGTNVAVTTVAEQLLALANA